MWQILRQLLAGRYHNIAGSSSGRMRDSGSRHLGSNPSPAAILRNCYPCDNGF